MNRFQRYVLAVIFCMAVLTGLQMNGNTADAYAASIRISSSSITLEKGHYKTLKIYGTNRKVSWYSSKSSVASVSSSGRVTAKATGTATVTALVSGRKLTCKVTVKEPVKISSTSITLYKGNTKTLKITGTSGKVTWTTSRSSVASVSGSGRITAKAAGTATVTALVSGKKLTCKVTVREKLPAIITPAPIPAITPTPSLTPVPATTQELIPSPTPTPISMTAPSPTPVPTPVPVPVTAVNPDKVLPADPADAGQIVGYYAAWAGYSGFTPDKIDAGKLTHINYAFANIGSDLKITLGYPDIDPTNISKLNSLKKTYPHLKTIIAVGGWSWSLRFSDAALTEESRARFADSCVDFIVKYGFDGIDIDWEYPVSGGLSTNIKRPADKQNFTLLLKKIREKLDARGSIDGIHYILSFAGAAGAWYGNNTELNLLHQYVDYANIMTYDIHGTWESTTNFNAPLYAGSDVPTPYNNWSVDAAVSSWMKAGFPKEKIILGVPFYGFVYQAVKGDHNGLYQNYSGGASISYGTIAAYYLNTPGYVRYFHPESKVPWLFNGTTFLTYDDEQSMRSKAEYIENRGLGGAMIWELSQDPNRVLLTSLYEGLKD